MKEFVQCPVCGEEYEVTDEIHSCYTIPKEANPTVSNKPWKPALWVLVGYGIADGILALTGNMTVSQLAYDAGQREPLYIWGTGVFFVWLFVHLFFRWKRVWNYFFPQKR